MQKLQPSDKSISNTSDSTFITLSNSTCIETDFQKYFEPKLIALGPLHHRSQRLERAEKTKLRFSSEENETTVQSLFNKIKAEVNDLRRYYDPKDIEQYADDELSQMFVVDGSVLLFAIHYGVERKFGKLKTKAVRLVFAPVDLFMLENQLPYGVLQILIDSTKEPKKWKDSITKFIADNVLTNIQSGQQSLLKIGATCNESCKRVAPSVPLTPYLARLYCMVYTHFSQPWTIVGFLGGITYLIFSGISTFVSSQKNIKFRQGLIFGFFDIN
ncbi:uncharacterized protein LOC120118790 [Hibiscus syriacus]|uniref:uncharacterized protein LOC120118790 n=1 Tax=Hibiscus syriacus TaxID=106335 RepID=UPI001921F8B1|nr:uncharacterized protein LOC120118790 [Hibiscus syriacus]